MTDTSTNPSVPVPPAAANGLFGLGSGKLGASVVSVMVLIGFMVLTFMAIKPESVGIADKSVLLFLLGAWQSLATAVVSYWIGSSSGSVDKSNQMVQMTQPPKPV